MCVYVPAIVDKTAAFVARNGIDFENKIREKEAMNSRFNFLSATDPYNAYYQHKVPALTTRWSRVCRCVSSKTASRPSRPCNVRPFPMR